MENGSTEVIFVTKVVITSKKNDTCGGSWTYYWINACVSAVNHTSTGLQLYNPIDFQTYTREVPVGWLGLSWPMLLLTDQD
jgi:hypothetical protein